MPYENIKKIRYATPKSQIYFFDTNVWLNVISASGTGGVSKKYAPYVDFFNSLLNSTIAHKPKIMMCSLLASEIANAYVHGIAFEQFKNGKSNAHSIDYKRDFRSHPDWQIANRFALDEIKGYNSDLIHIDDHFNDLKPAQLLKKCPPNTDFNDYYYHELCILIQKTQAISIVTNDGDFKYQDIEIITDLQALHDLYVPTNPNP